MPTIRTLCSGGELFGVGAVAAGYTHIDGYEIVDRVAAVARLNGFQIHTADICAVDHESLVAVDHLHASPSCKTASVANTAGGETADDLAVADAICRAIRAHIGRSFSLENVWGYRNFESFARILAALHSCDFVVDFCHLNAADFGVPQTRKRLILRAVRRSWRERVPPMHPTHRKGGDMFHTPWVGWYAAIEDLLPNLPDTQPAPWQLARLPIELREALLIGPGGYDGTVVQVEQNEPSFTVPAAGNHTQWRAFLLQGRNAGQEWGKRYQLDAEPSPTITGSDDRPAHRPVALLVGGQYMEPSGTPNRRVQHAPPLSPSWTVTVGAGKDTRAYVAGVWKRLDIRALGRLQTVPDSYRGLTPAINGNGVPPLLSQRITESLR